MLQLVWFVTLNPSMGKGLFDFKIFCIDLVSDLFDSCSYVYQNRYQLELKEEFIKRTEKLTENENRNKREYFNESKVIDWCATASLDHVYILFYFSVETARIQKESAVIDDKLEEHSRACSELRRLQVTNTTPLIQQCLPHLAYLAVGSVFLSSSRLS